MNSDTSSTLRIFVAIVLGIMFIASGIGGSPGSILGALIDTQDMSLISGNTTTGQF